MGNDVGVEERKGQAATSEEVGHHDHVDQPSHARGGTKFTSKGPKPDVLHGFKDGSMPTASEMAYDGKKDEVSIADAQSTALAAADIVQHQRMQEAGRAPARFYKALDLLYQAVTGHKRGDVDLVQMLDAAMVMLEPAIAPLRMTHEWAAWLDEQLMQHVTSARSSARYVRAKDRVDNSIRIDGKTVELPGEDEPRKQAALLRDQMHKLIPTMGQVNEQVIRYAEHGIEHEAKTLLKGEEPHGHKMGPGVLVQLQSALLIMDGFLTLTDEEFQEELKNIQGFANGVATYSELVKAATELLGGTLVITATYGAAVAKLMGDAASTAMLTGVARSTGLMFGNIIAGVEVVHGLAVMFDGSARTDKRIKAGFETASGLAWLLGKGALGASGAAILSTAVMLGYGELRLMAHLYWGAALGITSGMMGEAFKTIQRDGAAIAVTADKLARVKDLMQAEQNPEQQQDLKRVHDNLVHELAGDVDRLIGDCGPRERESGMAQYPGAWKILLEVFAPLRAHKGAKTEEQAVAAATVALERVSWALSHAGDLEIASAGNHSLKDLEHEYAKQQEHHGE